MKKLPLAQRLVLDGHCADSAQAAALVMAGKVLVNNRPARPGEMLGEKDTLHIKGQSLRYASKGGLKLEGALKAFHISPEGRVCLDAGASTGGFTDCLLQHGAKLVYAVDVGFGQLTGKLRQDARVVNLERTNLGDPGLLALSPVPTLASCDLSYLSLKDAVPLYRAILREGGQLLALVKPLFEVDDPEARRSGILDDSAYEPLLRDLCARLNSQPDTTVLDVCASPVTGNAGTLEFFLHLRFAGAAEQPDLEPAIRGSVKQALNTQPYRKTSEAAFEPT